MRPGWASISRRRRSRWREPTRGRSGLRRGSGSAAGSGAGTFDAVVSNPPYIPTGDLAALPPEVEFDPVGALDGGADGLAAYREIARELPGLLAPGGIAALEVGIGQAAAVAAMLAGNGLEKAKIVSDLANNPRVVVVRSGEPGQAEKRVV
jgi:release factor glutamine methyltransferase